MGGPEATEMESNQTDALETSDNQIFWTKSLISISLPLFKSEMVL
jgi:hypothetical protein